MLFFKTAIAALTAATLVSAMPPRWSSFDAEMCHFIGEPCDRPYGQCCRGLQCNLDTYECEEPYDAHKNEMCHFIGEPCDRPQGQCCPGLKCNLDYHECEEPYDAHKKEMCHFAGEPCDRAEGQCCSGLRCNLNKSECERPRAHNKLIQSNEMCYGPGYPCGSYAECCSEECYMGTCLPGIASPRRAHSKLIQSNKMCTPPGMPCEFGPCCTGQCIAGEFCA